MLMAANTNNKKVTAATNGTVNDERASISNAKSAPATNGYDTVGRASALPNARTVVSPAVTSAIETANRLVRVRTSTAPTAAGSTIIAKSAAWAPVIGQAPEPHRSEEHTSELQSRGQLVCRLLL